MFLIGEEQILAETVTDRDPDLTIAIEDLGGRPSRRPRSLHLPGAFRGARGLALLGLMAGAVAIPVALRPGGGSGPDRSHTSSTRSPLISRSAASVPAEPTARTHPRAAGNAEVHRLTVVHHRRSRHPHEPAPRKVVVTQSEPEREPTEPVAPVSLPVGTTTPSTPAPELAPQSTAEPTPPGPPPPSSSSGGPAGVETFGFER